MRAPAYRSKRWIKQNWRYLKLISKEDLFGNREIVRLSYDKRCGAIGGRTENGRARLCLPLAVIEQLWTPPKTKTGKDRKLTKKQSENNKALIDQINKKLKSNKTRVPWNPIVKQAVMRYQAQDKFKDDPKKRTRKRL